mmetsp:Transcript_64727/g.107554  ORF Transcript_64727/g.107554 Transcript_64727/m.107554 type:complete len:87 (-) Transcript_64727:731-991(-)
MVRESIAPSFKVTCVDLGKSKRTHDDGKPIIIRPNAIAIRSTSAHGNARLQVKHCSGDSPSSIAKPLIHSEAEMMLAVATSILYSG